MQYSRRTLLTSFALALVPFGATAKSDDAADLAPLVSPEGIEIQLKGDLNISTHFKDEADREGIVHAAISNGETGIVLNWNGCPAIDTELRMFLHNDGALVSGVKADVTGRLVFKTFKQLASENAMWFRTSPFWNGVKGKGYTPETPIPVVVVESIQIQVLPKEAHRARKRVQCTTVKTESK